MEKVNIGEYNVGDKLSIIYDENNPNNKDIEIRAIVDMEVVVYIDNNNQYYIDTVKYFNLLCRYNNLFKVT